MLGLCPTIVKRSRHSDGIRLIIRLIADWAASVALVTIEHLVPK